MIVLLGNDMSRIEVRFTNDKNYHVNGATRIRTEIICHFKGQITIDSIGYNI
ncbi:MAG: hypothetical protein ACRC0A_00520 [Chitinophagaceae bacterium]